MERTPQQIVALANEQEQATLGLRGRMDADWGLYMTEQYTGDLRGMDKEQRDNEVGYLHFTTSQPRSLYNKVHSLMIGAKRSMKISKSGEPRLVRDVGNIKEEWVEGVLRAADDRLKRLFQPKLMNLLSYYIPLRGWFFGRGMLKKRPDGRTIIDITPWDPRHVFWSVNEDGLEWIIYKMGRKPSSIRAEYGDIPGVLMDAEAENLQPVYDYYDNEHNITTLEEHYLKEPLLHEFPRAPVWYGNVGNAPLIGGASGVDVKITADVDWGESIYSATRDNYKTGSYVASVLLELLSRQREPPHKIRSPGGTKTIEFEDIFKSGTGVPLGEGEDIEMMNFIETTKDLAILWQSVQAEIQQGSLPYSAYGEIAFAISGFAINSLNESIGSFISPRLDAAVDATEQIVTLLEEQYTTGDYDALEVSGMGMGKKYFSLQASPEVIQQAGDHQFFLTAVLPQDDLGKIQAMALLREPGVNGLPIVDDDWIRTDHLKLPGEDKIRDAIFLQQAEMATPKARLYSLMRGAFNAGDEAMFKIYQFELQKLIQQELAMLQMFGILPPEAINGTNGANGGTPEGPQGFAPEVLPNAAQGIPPPDGGAGNSVPGRNRPQGAPRPGAQRSVIERLAAIGLGGPRG